MKYFVSACIVLCLSGPVVAQDRNASPKPVISTSGTAIGSLAGTAATRTNAAKVALLSIVSTTTSTTSGTN